MEEINFIRPQEVFNRNTGESKVRYTSYDGSNKFIPVVDGEDGVPRTLVVTTHAELKAMRDAGKLTPGSLYRITDYQCTTTQENTRSAGHQFDIVLLALSESKLAEEGWAMQHANDTYFANSNLSAWKIWYCLDNDTSRFAWADATNGKGVIYRLIDEWNNDVPYDFKNIQFLRKIGNDGFIDLRGGTDTYVYTFSVCNDDNKELSDYSVTCKTFLDDEGIPAFCYKNKIMAVVGELHILNNVVFHFLNIPNDTTRPMHHNTCVCTLNLTIGYGTQSCENNTFIYAVNRDYNRLLGNDIVVNNMHVTFEAIS